MTTTTEGLTLDTWIRDYARAKAYWNIPELKADPPERMPVLMQDGTLIFGFLSGVNQRWPKVVIEIHGSQLSIEFAIETIIRCLNEGRPLRA